uniref:RDD family protein n=1 Tax=candidate division WWE3 bacterium TaxID=2053526 RepID=A0A7C4XGE2_UNCKA
MQLNSSTTAGLTRRFFAFFLDRSLGLAVVLVALIIYAHYVRPSDGLDFIKSSGNVLTVILTFIFLSTLINLLYQILFLCKFGGTIGKLLFGMQVFDSETGGFLTPKKAFFRTFAGYAFSSQFMGLGFLKINKKRNNMAWHDELFSTEVRITGSIWPGTILLLLLLCIVLFVVFPILISLMLNFPVVAE